MKNAWKYAIVVIGALALAFSFGRLLFSGGAVPQNDYTLYVDVTNGQLYEIPQRGRTLLSTEAHPDQPGVFKLFKVQEDETSGSFTIPMRYLGGGDRPFTFNNVDLETGRVTVTDESPIRIN